MRYEVKKGAAAERPAKPALNRELLKFVACFWVLLIAVGARFLFPEELAEFRAAAVEVISSGAAYREAAAALGEAFSGEDGLISAVRRAYAYAFQTGEGEVEATGDAGLPENAVTAEEGGIVIAAGESTAFGRYIIVNGASGPKLYDHFSELRVREGARVEAGELLGFRNET